MSDMIFANPTITPLGWFMIAYCGLSVAGIIFFLVVKGNKRR